MSINLNTTFHFYLTRVAFVFSICLVFLISIVGILFQCETDGQTNLVAASEEKVMRGILVPE